MRIDLAIDLFPDPPSPIHLDTIASMAFDGRHRVIVDDDEDLNFQAWLGGLDDVRRDQWCRILDDGYRLEAREPATRVLKVSRIADPDWSRVPANVPVEDAARYLSLPFVGLLEDWHSDRAFLMAVATTEQRQFLNGMEKVGGLKFENGGGISNLAQQLTAITNHGLSEVHRSWAMFDSDALQPGQPSPQSQIAKKACVDGGIAFHQLERRCIENYIPKQNLHRWTFSTTKGQSDRRRLLAAFCKLTDDQRFHYNVKQGFHGDASRQGMTAGALFNSLASADRTALHNGFGKNIASLFETGEVYEHELVRDGSWPELSGMVSQLIALAR